MAGDPAPLHRPLPTDCHEHIIQDFNGESANSFVAPDHDLPAHLELRLTATDSDGLSSTVSLNLDPQTVALTFDSSPPGIVLKAGTTTHAAPFSKSFIVDGQVTVIAPPDQLINGSYYAWTNWSDAGPKTHTIKVPSVPTTYTANYTGGTPTDAVNTCEALATTSTRGQWYYNTLSSTSDVDWFRFSYPSAAYALATLGGLASNLRLDLYSACGTTPIASSDNSGTRFEEIYSQLPIGTYYLRVSYSSGTLNTGAPYGVRLSLLSDQVQVLSASSYLNSAGKQVVVGEVLNNTGDVKKQIQLEVTYYNAADVVLKTVTTSTFVDIMGMRTRSPFSVSVTKPAGYDHFGVVVSFSQRTSTSAYVTVSRTSLNVTSVPGPKFSGGLKNTNAFGIHAVNSIVTLYDNWGVVMNARSDPTSPTSLSANATGTFSSTFNGHYTGWSNATVIIEATKN